MTDLTVLNGQSIVFIGGGNMTSALVDGLIASKQTRNLSFTICVSDRNAPKREAFINKGVTAVSPDEVAPYLQTADIVVLSVKPQVLGEVCQTLSLPKTALIISVAAGVKLSALETMTGSTNIVRTMPNLPASVGFGATGLYADKVGDDEKACASAVVSASGIGVWVDTEDKLHAITAVAGSAPAYFFYVLEAMTAQAVAMGLDESSALALAAQTMQGAALMAKSGDPAELRAKVTSKGGTTHAAITHLQDNRVGEHLKNAMQACYERSVELGK